MEQAQNATQQVRLEREHARPDPTEEAARERFKRFGLARLRSALDYCVTKRMPPPRQRRSSEMHNWRVLAGCRCPLPWRFKMVPNGVGGS
jgi:hypothetical protein